MRIQAGDFDADERLAETSTEPCVREGLMIRENADARGAGAESFCGSGQAPSRRELAKISGMGKTAVADWLAGQGLPRSWDDGAVRLVDAIIKFAARCGKRFPDEEAVRQRCKAYYSARTAQPVNGQSAGINRHGEGDENALHRRSSDPRWPRVMRRRL